MVNPLGHKLLSVSKPGRYVGGEFGVVCAPWDQADLRWCLAFPEVYEIGMSHLGLNLIYHILNSKENVLADRVYAPWFDMEELLRKENQKLWGLESGKALNEFDVIGISIPYELTYTNIISILSLGGINPVASERGEDLPLIIGGGSGSFNPEPVSEFFDAILIGDGEDAVIQISEKILEAKRDKIDREKLIDSLGSIEGIYLPKFGSDNKTKRATVADIDQVLLPSSMIVPNIQIVHDRVGVEIQRGCTRGCRFCQAGMVYRPDRIRAKNSIINYLESTVEKSGYEECGLLSLSAGDYNGISDLICELGNKFKDKWAHISLPSLRTESLNKDVIGALSRSLKGGFTLAPEAATERLRRVINKGNSEEDFLASVERVFKTGWKNLKLYFMIGLPTETEEDIEAIPKVVKKVQQLGRLSHKFPNITVNVSTFIPKPHTPFQWEEQISLERTKEIQSKLRRMIKGAGLKLKLHNPEMSLLEGIFARGDRRLTKVLLLAYEKGCRFDAWDDQMKFDTWTEILKENEIVPDLYLAERNETEKLPWDHLFTDLSREFLIKEREKARTESFTPDCSKDSCSACGVCDFESLKPVTNVIARSEVTKQSPDKDNGGLLRSARNDMELFRYCLQFSKTGNAIFIGHIDLMNIFRRAFRRAGLPLKYSEGFNRRSKISFPVALSVGIESEDEWCEIELTEEWDPEKIKEHVENVFPSGINIIGITKKSGSLGFESCIYKIEIIHPSTGSGRTESCLGRTENCLGRTDLEKSIEEFYTAQSVKVIKRGKRGPKEIDLKDSVIRLAQISDHVIEGEIKSGAGAASIRDVAKWLFGGTENIKIVKVKSCLTN